VTVLYKYARYKPGLMRIYYRSTKKTRHLYCIQNDGTRGKDDYKFYACCNKDGEPFRELPFPASTSFDRLEYPRSLENGEKHAC
jgi:hypothetical protein